MADWFIPGVTRARHAVRLLPFEEPLMAKSKLVKRLGLAVALILAGVAFFVTFSAYLYKAAPDFYRRGILSPAARDAAAQIAEQKLIAARNWAEHTQAI